MTSALPPAPPSLDDGSGAPRFGTYQGGLDEIDLSRLRGVYRPNAMDRFRMHKKWIYAFVATREVAAMFAVVDVGYASNAFTMAVDLASRKVLIDGGFLGPPRPLVQVNDRPGAGLEVALRLPLARFEAARPFGDERYHLAARMGVRVPLRPLKLDLALELLAAGAPPPLTVVAPVDGGVLNVTQKWAGLLAMGQLQAGGKRFTLDGGVGGLDYTNGYLARSTAWRWGFGCGRLDDGTPLGLNLVEGFNEAREDVNENAIWLGHQLFPVGRARFTFDRENLLEPWSVKTHDGALDLTFTPMAMHREHRNLKVVKSRFAQPMGLWSGRVAVGDRVYSVKDVPGVTEDQAVTW